jgi:hypothetical protein
MGLDGFFVPLGRDLRGSEIDSREINDALWTIDETFRPWILFSSAY